MTARPILLDTHVALWLSEGGILTARAQRELETADAEGTPILISPITAWEIGLLAAQGRLALPLPPDAWCRALVEEGLSWAPLTPEVLVASSFLPGEVHGDQADRVLVATARAFNYRLMTRDRGLLRYAKRGHVQALPC